MLNVQKRSKATFKNHMQTLQTLVPTTLKPTLEHCNPKTLGKPCKPCLANGIGVTLQLNTSRQCSWRIQRGRFSPVPLAAPSSSTVFLPSSMVAPSHVSSFLATGDGGTTFSSVLLAASLQEQTLFANCLKKDPL